MVKHAHKHLLYLFAVISFFASPVSPTLGADTQLFGELKITNGLLQMVAIDDTPTGRYFNLTDYSTNIPKQPVECGYFNVKTNKFTEGRDSRGTMIDGIDVCENPDILFREILENTQKTSRESRRNGYVFMESIFSEKEFHKGMERLLKDHNILRDVLLTEYRRTKAVCDSVRTRKQKSNREVVQKIFTGLEIHERKQNETCIAGGKPYAIETSYPEYSFHVTSPFTAISSGIGEFYNRETLLCLAGIPDATQYDFCNIYPQIFAAEDKNLAVAIDGNRDLIISNKTSEYVKILAITIYYQSFINTLNFSHNMPPVSSIKDGELLSRLASFKENAMIGLTLDDASKKEYVFGISLLYQLNSDEIEQTLLTRYRYLLPGTMVAEVPNPTKKSLLSVECLKLAKEEKPAAMVEDVKKSKITQEKAKREGLKALTAKTTILSSRVKVRKTPTRKSEGIEIIDRGRLVSVIGTIDYWYQIKTPEGNTGWVLKSQVRALQ
ncbi:MAG: hypothetical protein CSYNP_02838 [Syntrophus sp. SKADARSKE-3]|nr:hypothetical protein [Syntrophus sp. SKADARSKE-3]